MENTEQNPFSWASVKKNIKELFTWQYYKEGFSGWDPQAYIWMFTGWVILTIIARLHGLTNFMQPLSLMSLFGGMIGFACTLAITSGKRINGLLGFISAILISIVAFHAGNYSDIVMQAVYVVILDLNFMLFGDAWQKRDIKAMDRNGWILGCATIVIAYILLYIMDTSVLHSPRPMIDAFAAAIGVTGGVLTVAKYHSQFWLWTAQGIMSVILWGITAAQGDANWVLFAVYFLYLGNDVIGLWFSPWAREAKAQKN